MGSTHKKKRLGLVELGHSTFFLTGATFFSWIQAELYFLYHHYLNLRKRAASHFWVGSRRRSYSDFTAFLSKIRGNCKSALSHPAFPTKIGWH